VRILSVLIPMPNAQLELCVEQLFVSEKGHKAFVNFLGLYVSGLHPEETDLSL
jgi:hypothetical protein